MALTDDAVRRSCDLERGVELDPGNNVFGPIASSAHDLAGVQKMHRIKVYFKSFSRAALREHFSASSTGIEMKLRPAGLMTIDDKDWFHGSLSPGSRRGSQRTTSGTKVMRASTAIITHKNGGTSRTISLSGTSAMRVMMKSNRPQGGMMSPIMILTTTTTPR
jgi:hypothetical protein